MKIKFETWEQTIIWEWCRECSISWRLGDKPLCTCKVDEIQVIE